MRPVEQRLTEIACQMKLAPEELITQAVARAREKGIGLAEAMVEMGLATPERVRQLVSLAEASTQTCVIHRNKLAVGVCSSCHKPACELCLVERAGVLLCSSCAAARPEAKPKKPWATIVGASAAGVILLCSLWYASAYLKGTGHYRKGLNALEANEPERAEGELRACLAWKEYRDCRFRLGLALRKQGKAAESAEELSRYALLHPDDALTHAELARSRRLAGDGPGCRKAYARASELNPRDEALARERALFLAEACPEEDEALQAARASLELDGEDREMLWKLASLLEQRGEKEAALEALSRALSPPPGTLSAGKKHREGAFLGDRVKAARLRIHAARLAASLGREEEALRYAAAAHELMRMDVDAACFYSKLLLNHGESRKARNVVAGLAVAGARDPRYLRTVCDLARAANERSALKKALRGLISIDPADEGPALEYTRLCLAEGMLDEAEKTLAALRSPPPLERQLLRVRLRYARGDAAGALVLAEKLLAQHLDSPEAAAVVALGWRLKGEPLRACALVREKLDGGLCSPRLFLEGGTAFWAAGFPERADELLERGGEAGAVFLRRLRGLGWVRGRSKFELDLRGKTERLPPQRYADTAVALARAKCALYELVYGGGGGVDFEKNVLEMKRWTQPPRPGEERPEFLGNEARRLAFAEAEAARVLSAALGLRSRAIVPKGSEDPFIAACKALELQGDFLAGRLSSARGARVAIRVECIDGKLRAQKALSASSAQEATASAQRLVELIALEVSSGPTGFAYAPLAAKTVDAMWKEDAKAGDIMTQMGSAGLACTNLLLLLRTRQAEGPTFTGVELEAGK